MNKVDPGPAFQWETVINGARSLLHRDPPAALEKAAERSMRLRQSEVSSP
jgi:N-acetyl-anhydromuramyl-L-alanine amidase AmpD